MKNIYKNMSILAPWRTGALLHKRQFPICSRAIFRIFTLLPSSNKLPIRPFASNPTHYNQPDIFPLMPDIVAPK